MLPKLLAAERRVYDEKIDDQPYYVRALTRAEAKRVDEKPEITTAAVLFYGLVDKQGVPLFGSTHDAAGKPLAVPDSVVEQLEDVPLDVLHALRTAILEKSSPKKV